MNVSKMKKKLYFLYDFFFHDLTLKIMDKIVIKQAQLNATHNTVSSSELEELKRIIKLF